MDAGIRHSWTQKLTHRLLAVAMTGVASGCTVVTPYQLWQVRADYNTERRWATQIEVREHLPPKPAAVRTMTWGYNVGPSPSPATASMIPVDAPVEPLVPAPTGVRPGGPSQDLLDRSEPPALPPTPSRSSRSGSRTPPRDPRSMPTDEPTDQGPTALWPERIRPIGYAAPAGKAPDDPPAAWLFAR